MRLLGHSILVALTFVLILVLGSSAICEPSDNVRYLINEPVSLLDLGCMRLGHMLADNIGGSDFPIVDVTYDWDNNKIIIYLAHYSHKPTEEYMASIVSNTFIASVKELLMVDADTCVPGIEGDTCGPHSLVGGYFNHTGVMSNHKPEDLECNIDQIVDIVARYQLDEKNVLVSKCRLLDKHVYTSVMPITESFQQ